jgi:hypothetical protein
VRQQRGGLKSEASEIDSRNLAMTRAAKTLSVDPGSTDITGFNALRHRSTAPMKLSNNYRLSAFGP